MSADTRLRIGFIPLADATALLVAVDKGFAAAEGLDVELVREVSWSNVRDKLNIGLFDAAHLIAPVAIASSLGLGHVKVPIVAPFGLGVNGNAITVSPALHAAMAAAADGDTRRSDGVGARARPRGRRRARRRGEEPLTFGMTFPFSTHNYHLRFWMAAGGVDPDEDVRLVVLPPPYMVESLRQQARRRASASARRGIRSRSISASATSCISSPRSWRARPKRCWRCGSAGREENPDTLRAPGARASDAPPPSSRTRATATRSPRCWRRPTASASRAEVIRRTLDGRLKVSPDGTVRSERSLPAGRPRGRRRGPTRRRPRGSTRRWCAGVRRRCRAELLAAAKAVFRPDLYDAALGRSEPTARRAGRRHRRLLRVRRSTRERHRRAPRGLENPTSLNRSVPLISDFALHKIFA